MPPFCPKPDRKYSSDIRLAALASPCPGTRSEPRLGRSGSSVPCSCSLFPGSLCSPLTTCHSLSFGSLGSFGRMFLTSFPKPFHTDYWKECRARRAARAPPSRRRLSGERASAGGGIGTGGRSCDPRDDRLCQGDPHRLCQMDKECNRMKKSQPSETNIDINRLRQPAIIFLRNEPKLVPLDLRAPK